MAHRIERVPAIAFAALIALAPAAAGAADGDPDPAFGDDGQLTIERGESAPGFTVYPGDLAAIGDGRIAWILAGHDGSVAIGRLLSDGAPDPAFGDAGNGRIVLDRCAGEAPTRLLANADGSLIAWGGRCLVRVEADGTIDEGFGDGAALDLRAAAIARDPLGRIVVAASRSQTLHVLRFDANGAVDDSFGAGGEVVLDVPATNGLRDLAALAIRPDARILVAGWRGNSSGPNLIVAALTADGSVDTSWNGNGLVDLDPVGADSGITATAIALDAQGRLVVAGDALSGSVSCCLVLTRFDAHGALDRDFGIRRFALDGASLGSFFESRDALSILGDGRILFGVTAFPTPTGSFDHRTAFVLIRALADGSLDSGFGDAGWRAYTIRDPEGIGQSGDYDQLHAVAVDHGAALMFGRTFFEDQSNGHDYVSFVRASFDRVFADGFDIIIDNKQ